jgi:hypothetical protein
VKPESPKDLDFPTNRQPQSPPRGLGLMENLAFGFRASSSLVDVESVDALAAAPAALYTCRWAVPDGGCQVYKVRFDLPHLGVGMHGPVYRAVHRKTNVSVVALRGPLSSPHLRVRGSNDNARPSTR